MSVVPVALRTLLFFVRCPTGASDETRLELQLGTDLTSSASQFDILTATILEDPTGNWSGLRRPTRFDVLPETVLLSLLVPSPVRPALRN